MLADGADFESSVPYHRLVAELFLGGARLAASQTAPLSRAYLDRLRMMIEYLAAVLRPDGLMPVVGDADDGRLHIASGYGAGNPQDSRHLLAAAGAFFGRDDWMLAAGPDAGGKLRGGGSRVSARPRASRPPPSVACGIFRMLA